MNRETELEYSRLHSRRSEPSSKFQSTPKTRPNTRHSLPEQNSLENKHARSSSRRYSQRKSHDILENDTGIKNSRRTEPYREYTNSHSSPRRHTLFERARKSLGAANTVWDFSSFDHQKKGNLTLYVLKSRMGSGNAAKQNLHLRWSRYVGE